jgi:hypothetical protein
MAVQDRLFNSSIAIAAGRSDCAGSLADEAPESAHQVSSSNVTFMKPTMSCELICATSSTPITSPVGSRPSRASPPMSSSAKPGLHSRKDSQSARSRKRRD